MTQSGSLSWLMVQEIRSRFFVKVFHLTQTSVFQMSDEGGAFPADLQNVFWEPRRGKRKCFLRIHRDGEWIEEVKKKIQVQVGRQIHNTKIFTHSFNLTGCPTALNSCRPVQSTWLSEGLWGPFRANIIQVSWKKALWGNANVQPWKRSEEELGRKRKVSLQLFSYRNN